MSNDSRIVLGILPPKYPEAIDAHGFDFATFDDGLILAIRIDPDEDAQRLALVALEDGGADPVILANQCPALKEIWIERTRSSPPEPIPSRDDLVKTLSAGISAGWSPQDLHTMIYDAIHDAIPKEEDE